MRVFLTGATGLIGSHLADELVRGGHEVVALCRQSADTSFLSSLGCEIAAGDVRGHPTELAPALEQCTHLVHGAALVYADEGWSVIHEVNVQGTTNIISAAFAAGVRHVVHISSVAVYGTVDGEIDESTSVETTVPSNDLYARSKREAEQEARRLCGLHGLSLAVVRPSAVYGERDRLMAPTIAAIVRMPIVPLFGHGENTLPVVYAGNVAGAIVLALEAGSEATYDVGMDHPLTQRALFEGLSAGLSVSPRFLRVPARLVRAGASVMARLGIGTPGARHLPLDRVVRLALGENPYPSRRIRDELGWSPTHQHSEALARTGAWLATTQ
jgi:nucleoside-diphosphate-sugar epimerase